jgi:hypothetical protein
MSDYEPVQPAWKGPRGLEAAASVHLVKPDCEHRNQSIKALADETRKLIELSRRETVSTASDVAGTQDI